MTLAINASQPSVLFSSRELRSEGKRKEGRKRKQVKERKGGRRREGQRGGGGGRLREERVERKTTDGERGACGRPTLMCENAVVFLLQPRPAAGLGLFRAADASYFCGTYDPTPSSVVPEVPSVPVLAEFLMPNPSSVSFVPESSLLQRRSCQGQIGGSFTKRSLSFKPQIHSQPSSGPVGALGAGRTAHEHPSFLSRSRHSSWHIYLSRVFETPKPRLGF